MSKKKLEQTLNYISAVSDQEEVIDAVKSAFVFLSGLSEDLKINVTQQDEIKQFELQFNDAESLDDYYDLKEDVLYWTRTAIAENKIEAANFSLITLLIKDINDAIDNLEDIDNNNDEYDNEYEENEDENENENDDNDINEKHDAESYLEDFDLSELPEEIEEGA
jgi:hypothetical protein